MPIEFHCPSCNQQLRVPDAAAGKNAKCPKCATIVAVPAAAAPTAPAISPVNFGQTTPMPPHDFGAPASNPFASHDLGPSSGGNFGGPAANPYASPGPISEQPYGMGGYQSFAPRKIQPTVVDLGTILNRASRLWQDNLGLLVGVTVVYLILVLVVSYACGAAQLALMFGGNRALFFLGSLILQTMAVAWQSYMNVGMLQLCFKLGRLERAEFGHLFGGGPQFLPVFIFNLLVHLLTQFPALLGQVLGNPFKPEIQMVVLVAQFGVLILVFVGWLFLWPVQAVLADNQASFANSFGEAMRITQGNKLTSFLLMLLSIGIALAGILAVCIGVIFAIPLISLIWAVAYLMMAGQIPPYSSYQQTYQQPMYR